ncbi:MAG: DMT family transporter [Saprospiraceae bacterium]
MKSSAFWAVLCAACIAGSAGLFIKSMSISPVSQAWLRMAIPTIVMAIWMRLEGIAFFRGNWKKMTLISIMGTVRMVLFFVAYTYATIGNAVIIFYTFPIFSAIFGFVLLREQVNRRQQLLLLMAFTGIVLAFSNKPFSLESNDFIGMMAAMASALIYALTVVLFKSESKNYSWKELVFYQNFSGLILLLPFFQFGAAMALDYTLGITYGLLIGVIVFGLFFFGLKRLPASIAAALMYMEVVSAIVLSTLFMGEQLSWPMIFGGILILGSSLLLKRTS